MKISWDRLTKLVNMFSDTYVDEDRLKTTSKYLKEQDKKKKKKRKDAKG